MITSTLLLLVSSLPFAEPAAARFVFPAPAAARADETPANRIVATVNGEAITERELSRLAPPDATEAVKRAVLQQLVIEKRVDQEAKAAGIKVTDDRLAAALEERRDAAGGALGYQKFLAALGRTAEADRREVRRALEGEEYIARCLGESPDPKLLRADLVRRLEVSTKEVQEAWRKHRDQFRKPGAVDLVMVLVKKDAHPTPEAARTALEAALAARSAIEIAGALGHPTLKAEYAGFSATKKTLNAAEIESLLPALRQVAREGEAGASSPIAESESAFLAIQVESRQPDVQLEFAAAGDLIRAWLRGVKRAEAVNRLCAELIAEATIWPPDLFAAVENSPEGPR